MALLGHEQELHAVAAEGPGHLGRLAHDAAERPQPRAHAGQDELQVEVGLVREAQRGWPAACR